MIVRHFFLGLLFCIAVSSAGQERKTEGETETQEMGQAIEIRLEELTENNEGEVTEDDNYLQDMEYFSRHRIDLNNADKEALERLHILNVLQIDHFITYRNLLGKLVSIYELQAVPGWDLETIRKVLPYVTVQAAGMTASALTRPRGGEHLLLARYTRNLELSEGYKRDGTDGRAYYPGSADKFLIRYKYRGLDRTQFGFTAEKDAGEQFFAGHQKHGFDFYSAHFFRQNSGFVRAIAVGDYTVNFGQGLIQWQSLSFAGPADAMYIKRQGGKLRPYSSAGEVAFNRGAGITIGKNNWEGTIFVSFRNLDTSSDSAGNFATSIRLSGLHRTLSEREGKGWLSQSSYGANLQYNGQQFKIGINTVQYHFDKRLMRGEDLYRKFLSPGKSHSNYSIDYSYTFRNMHLFGEAAVDKEGDRAFINGMALSFNRYVDAGILYRHISAEYLTLYGDAFTQSTSPVNENGLYMGLNIRPVNEISVDVYADIFSFPWLRYRVDAPSQGSEYMMQLKYRPRRGAEFYIRYRTTDKAINTTIAEHPTSVVANKTRQNLRLQMNLQLTGTITFRTRTESVWYDSKTGFTIYGDLLYRPTMKKLSGNLRLQYFETEDYDTRIYAFENDVLYSYSIPVAYGKGYRYYVNLRYNLSRKVSLWARLARTQYTDRDEIGSGLDKIDGNRKTELKIELVCRF